MLLDHTGVCPVWPGNLKAPHSGRRPVVIVQHSTQMLSPLDCAGPSHMTRLWLEQAITQALMVPFRVVMDDKVLHRCP